MVRKDVLSSLFFILLSIYICWKSVGLSLGRFSKPGGGFFPFLSGLVIGCLAITIFFKAWITKTIRERVSREQIPWRSVLLTFCCMVGFTLFVDLLGFNFTTALFVGLLLRTVEKKGWRITAIAAIGITLGAYLVFDVFLRSQLPRGPFGF